MTSYWGPLGWATLHSASLIYSDSPSYEEQTIMSRFLDCFKATISCYHCKTHFIDMLSKYSKIYLLEKILCYLYFVHIIQLINE